MSKSTPAAPLPKQIMIYICDYVDESPVFSVAEATAEIPEDLHGEPVGIYQLVSEGKLNVEKSFI